MSARDIYDFEGITETAAQQVLAGLQVTAATTQDAPKFQKARPRVEIKYTHGPGLGRFAVVINGVNLALDASAGLGLSPAQLFYARRESAWQFRLQFNLLTAAQIEVHTSYRATVRSALAQFWWLINGVAPMTRHSVQLAKDNGSSPILIAPEEGLMKTEMSFDGTISVQADAWGALSQ